MIKNVSEVAGINLVEGETVDETFENYARILQDSGLVKEVQFKKLGPEKYEMSLSGCPFAKEIHP